MATQVVSFRCILSDRLGRVISSTVSRDVLLNPDADDVPLRALSDGMRDLKAGERRRICLRADQAYGFYDPALVITRGYDASEVGYRMHEVVKFVRDSGETLWTRVIGLAQHTVTLDGNHPLAGQDLVFEIQTLNVRDATPGEVAESAASPAPGLH